MLEQLQHRMRRSLEDALQSANLTFVQAHVLTELAYGPPRSNAELARLHFVTPQSMVEVLISLEHRNLIARAGRPEGGRAMLAQLTEEGTHKVFGVHLAMRKVEEQLLRSLSKDDVSRLRAILEECLKALEQPTASA